MRKLTLMTAVGLLVLVLGTSLVFGEGVYQTKKAATPVVIDGVLTEWEGIPALELTLEDGGKATFKCQWDSNFLYVAVVVEDKVHYNPYTGSNIWQGDNLQLALDGRNNKSMSYDADDYEYGWALTDSGLEAWAWQVATGVTFKADLMSFIVVPCTEDNPVTIYEIAIPKELIQPAKLEAGYQMGFNWLVNDNDGAGRAYVEWTLGVGNQKNPSYFDTLLLVN